MVEKIKALETEPVEEMPEELKPGIIYVSQKYEIAIHLCACGGCGQRTVTSFGSWKDSWKLTLDEENRVTLSPSIGNFQMPCRSHYWVKKGEIVWC